MKANGSDSPEGAAPPQKNKKKNTLIPSQSLLLPGNPSHTNIDILVPSASYPSRSPIMEKTCVFVQEIGKQEA